MTLFVYKTSVKNPSHQNDEFRKTKLNTCNTESPRGLRLRMSTRYWYFEVEANELYKGEKHIKGIMRKGPIQYEATFESMFMLKHTLLHMNRWNFGF